MTARALTWSACRPSGPTPPSSCSTGGRHHDGPLPRPLQLARYETPTDPEAFDRHYREVHIPFGRRLPGLRRYTVSRDIAGVRGGAPNYLVAELEWDTMDDLWAAFAAPEGRVVATDAARFQELASVRSMTFTVDDSAPKAHAPT